jgi:Uncharacterized protein conserved in bacteria C-term(DUF2220)
MLIELDPARVEDFKARLLAHPRIRMDRTAVWACFAAAFPGRPQGAEERRWLRCALEHLAAGLFIRLPSKNGRLWDHAMGVSLPSAIELIRTPRPPHSLSWRTFPWHPRLSWITDLRALSPAEHRFLTRIHDGLVNGAFTQAAPLKYRSLQLTGDEKQLGRLTTTRLFGAGRLDLQLLGCVEQILPMPWHAIASKPTMLIVENPDTYSVIRNVLKVFRDPSYGLIGYGGGAAFEYTIRYLPSIERPIDEIHYIGDVDRPGLRIVSAANKVARHIGLPEITPSPHLHATMLDACERFGKPLGWPHRSAAHGPLPGDEDLLRWLPAQVRNRARQVIQSAQRIPEEILGPDELKAVWGPHQ